MHWEEIILILSYVLALYSIATIIYIVLFA